MTPNASRKELLSISWQMKHNENKTFGGRGHLVWKIILNKRHHTQENNICKRTNDVRPCKTTFFCCQSIISYTQKPQKPGTRDSRELSRFLAQSRNSRFSRLSRLVEIQLPSLIQVPSFSLPNKFQVVWLAWEPARSVITAMILAICQIVESPI